MNYQVRKYKAEYQAVWDDFITRSANGTFMHQRKYMDYHADRFTDASLMIFEGEKLKAVFPAHRVENQIIAHNGLTYSDFIFHFKLKTEHKIQIIEQSLAYLKNQGIKQVIIKDIPFVFHQIIDETNRYIYDRLKAKILKIKPFFVAIKQNTESPNRNRIKNLKKIDASVFSMHTGIDNLPGFWEIVQENLRERYQSKPVHRLDEIKLLINNFPDKIRLFTVAHKNITLAGAVVYIINNSIHFQYIHAKNDPLSRKAVEWLVYQIVELYQDREYISFGTSESQDNNLHSGLVYWKQSFACRIINQYFIAVSTANHNHLKDVLQ